MELKDVFAILSVQDTEALCHWNYPADSEDGLSRIKDVSKGNSQMTCGPFQH